MESEFSGKMDKDKTLPIEPRPLTRPADKIRALNLTGDATGNSDTDGRFFFRGLNRDRFVALRKESLRRRKTMPDRIIEVGDQQA